jgi:GT2 family glycosyltransferase
MPQAPSNQVVYGYLRPTSVHGDFMESLLDLLDYDRSHARRIAGRLGFRSSANLASGRNAIVKHFLESSDAGWLLMLDTDMVFAPDTLERLLEHADPVTAPIVGALCFGFDEMLDVQPTLFGLEEDPEHPGDPSHFLVTRHHDWTPESMYPVAGTGAAALLMHREALEKVRADQYSVAYPWFQELEHNGQAVGEDLGFCFRAVQSGYPIYVNTAVQVGHVKDRVLTAETFYLSRGLLAPTHPGAAV